MTTSFEVRTDQIAKWMAQGVEGEFKKLVRDRLEEQAKLIVEQVAAEIAERLRIKLFDARDPYTASVNMALVIDGVPK